jgi:hypothetical protein
MRYFVAEEKKYVLVGIGEPAVFGFFEGQRSSSKSTGIGVCFLVWKTEYLEKGEKENGIKGDQVLKRLKNGIWNPAIWER